MHIRITSNARFVLHIASYIALMNLLVHSYLQYQAPIWGYLGYSVDYTLARHFISNIVMAVLASLIVPTRIVGLTSFILSLVVSSTVVAMVALYAARGYSILYLISIVAFLLIVKVLGERIRFRIPPRRSSTIPIIALSGGVFGASIAWIAARGGLANINFDITKIYSIRSFALEQYAVGPFAYLINWSQKAFGTTLFAIGLVSGSVVLVGIAVAGQIFFYATMAQKTPLAMLFFVIFAIAVTKYRPTVFLLNILLAVIIILSEILYEYGYIQPIALVVLRIFFAPANSNIFYFEFFSENPFTYFSTTFLRSFVEYQFDLSVFELISLLKTGQSETTTNVGALGTGYQHMGYLGLLIYAVLSGLFLSIFESLGKGLPMWLPLAVAGPPIYIMFTSTDLPVAMVTNGGFIAMLVLFLWPSDRTW